MLKNLASLAWSKINSFRRRLTAIIAPARINLSEKTRLLWKNLVFQRGWQLLSGRWWRGGPKFYLSFTGRSNTGRIRSDLYSVRWSGFWKLIIEELNGARRNLSTIIKFGKFKKYKNYRTELDLKFTAKIHLRKVSYWRGGPCASRTAKKFLPVA